MKELDPNYESGAEPRAGRPRPGAGGGGPRRAGARASEDSKTPALSTFGRDLTELARKGELDPVIGARTRSSA
jgi:ATP-dependent Clp protease ATP-binding subunit ClpC